MVSISRLGPSRAIILSLPDSPAKPSWIQKLAQLDEKTSLRLIVVSLCAVGVLDWILASPGGGVLYLIPVVLAGLTMPMWPVAMISAVCAILHTSFGPVNPSIGVILFSLNTFFAYTATGLATVAVGQKRRASVRMGELERAKAEAEHEAAVMVDSSPAAILTVDTDGTIRRANTAAEKLFGVEAGTLVGRQVEPLIPTLAKAVRSPTVSSIIRTMVESRGYRPNGEPFFAQMWLSSYPSASGTMVAAIIYDASEQVRDREEAGLSQLLAHSRILAGAVTHEVRNLAAAVGTLHYEMGQTDGVANHPAYSAMAQVIEQLRRLTTQELVPAESRDLSGLDVANFLADLRIILNGMFSDMDCRITMEISESLPRARGDQQALMQVFLNLARNAQKAMAETEAPAIRLAAYQLEKSIMIRFANDGPTVADPDQLFMPFKSGTQSSGLGLYVSRAVVRTFGGELHHVPQANGACFVVELSVASRRQE